MDIGLSGLYMSLFIALYFEVFLLISFFEKRPTKKDARLPKLYPTVSMLVPCYNEEATLGQTLDSLLALSYPKDRLDIVVVDDGSKDNTAAIAAVYAKKYPQISLVSKHNGGKYTALNVGIEKSRGEIIGCLDADSFVVQDALVEAVKTFESDMSIMAITPAMKVYRPRKVLELMQHVEYTFGIFFKKMFDNLSAINVLPGPFSLYKREVFAKIGPFRHAHNTEDMEIAFRMHAHGLKIVNAHTATVYTTVPNTIRALLRQRTRWSQGFLQNARDYGYMYFNRRFGNFGLLVLPFATISFFAGIYTALYVLYRFINSLAERVSNSVQTGIPPHLPPHFDALNWYLLNTGTMLFLTIAVLSTTFVAIVLGSQIAQSKIGPKSLVAYFAFFGFLAPIWLIRAVWGALLAQESSWR